MAYRLVGFYSAHMDRSRLVTKFAKGFRNPSLAMGKLRSYGLKINSEINKLGIDEDNITKIPNEDWDNLIILDGCRYDTFAEEINLNGDLHMRYSVGSQSLEFLQKNFTDSDNSDTVYISANPYTSKLESGNFHNLIELYEYWDEELQTITPDIVRQESISAFERYPDKRLIVHFMQPHYPFIGPTGQKIDHRGHHRSKSDSDISEHSIWYKMQYGLGTVNRNTIWKAYRENLNIVLAEVERLIKVIEGKTIISSDHGNLIGDRTEPLPIRGYGHPPNHHISQLREVPWFVCSFDRRRDIVSEPPVDYAISDSSLVDDRLEALGYKN